MAEINSPLGKRTFESTDVAHFEVDDATEHESQPEMTEQQRAREIMAARERMIAEASAQSDDTSEASEAEVEQAPSVEFTMEEIAQARKRKMELLNKATSAEKRRIELLTGIGRAYKDVEVIDGEDKVVFTIHTLKSREIAPIMEKQDLMFKTRKREIAVDIKHLTLAFAVSAIDGIDIDDLLGCANLENKIDIKVAFFEEMDEAVTQFLLVNFEKLEEKNKSRYSLRTPAQVKEVAEQLKKSSKGT